MSAFEQVFVLVRRTSRIAGKDKTETVDEIATEGYGGAPLPSFRSRLGADHYLTELGRGRDLIAVPLELRS